MPAAVASGPSMKSMAGARTANRGVLLRPSARGEPTVSVAEQEQEPTILWCREPPRPAGPTRAESRERLPGRTPRARASQEGGEGQEAEGADPREPPRSSPRADQEATQPTPTMPARRGWCPSWRRRANRARRSLPPASVPGPHSRPPAFRPARGRATVGTSQGSTAASQSTANPQTLRPVGRATGIGRPRPGDRPTRPRSGRSGPTAHPVHSAAVPCVHPSTARLRSCALR